MYKYGGVRQLRINQLTPMFPCYYSDMIDLNILYEKEVMTWSSSFICMFVHPSQRALLPVCVSPMKQAFASYLEISLADYLLFHKVARMRKANNLERPN